MTTMNTQELQAKRPKKQARPRVRIRVTARDAYLTRMNRAFTTPADTATRAMSAIPKPKRAYSSGARM